MWLTEDRPGIESRWAKMRTEGIRRRFVKTGRRLIDQNVPTGRPAGNPFLPVFPALFQLFIIAWRYSTAGLVLAENYGIRYGNPQRFSSFLSA
jgi:hypothetical protein